MIKINGFRKININNTKLLKCTSNLIKRVYPDDPKRRPSFIQIHPDKYINTISRNQSICWNEFVRLLQEKSSV